MNTFTTLFSNEFEALLRGTGIDDIASGYLLVQMLRQLRERQLVVLSPALSKKLDKRCFRPTTDIQLDKNWSFLQEVFQTVSFELSRTTIELLKKKNNAFVTSFAYQLFNFSDVLKYSKAKKETGSSQFESTNFQRLEAIKGLSDCNQIFEKMVWLLAKAEGSCQLNVRLSGSAVFRE